LKAPNKIAFLHLWPHARPWRIAAPQPTLRALVDAQAAANILATAMEARTAIERAPAGRPERVSAPSAGLGQPEAVAA
jgi:hypothetical protein